VTGPEHYQAAERLLQPRTTHTIPSGEPRQAPPTTDMILQAQVHATLALAAATAMNDAETGMPMRDWDAWKDACSTPKASDG